MRHLPDGDHECGSQKDADLPEVHFLASVVVACGAEDHELDVLVETLELRAQVKRLGVFYRKLVETEGLPHLGEFFRQRLERPSHTNPPLPASSGCLVEGNRALVLAATISVVRTVDDHHVLLSLFTWNENGAPGLGQRPVDVRNSGDAMDPGRSRQSSASRAVWTSGRGRSSVCLFAALLAKAHFRLGHGENRGGGLMTDATAKFFDALVERGHEPLLEKATGTLRFDLKDGKRTDRWLVAVVKGTSRSRAGICGQTAF